MHTVTTDDVKYDASNTVPTSDDVNPNLNPRIITESPDNDPGLESPIYPKPAKLLPVEEMKASPPANEE